MIHHGKSRGSYLLVFHNIAEVDELALLRLHDPYPKVLTGFFDFLVVVIVLMGDARYSVLFILEADAMFMAGVPIRLLGNIIGRGPRVVPHADCPGDWRHVDGIDHTSDIEMEAEVKLMERRQSLGAALPLLSIPGSP